MTLTHNDSKCTECGREMAFTPDLICVCGASSFEDLYERDRYGNIIWPPEEELQKIEAAQVMHEGLLCVDDLRDLRPPAPLIPTLFDLDTLVLAYGRRGSYKSFLAVDWALHVAKGQRWNTQRVEKGCVVYVCAEGAHGLVQRIDAWRNHHGVVDSTIGDLLVYPNPINLLSPSSVGTFADVAWQLNAKLVIFDTLARCMVGGDENSSKDAGMAIEQLDVVRKRTGACVIAVHHSGKSAEAGARGSSAFEAAADTVLEVTAAEGLVTLKTTKQKHHPEGTPWYLRAVPSEQSVVLALAARTAADELSESVLQTLATLAQIQVPGGVTAAAWRVAVDVPERTFYRHRSSLLTAGLIDSLGTEHSPRYLVSDAGTAVLPKDCHALQ